jgi:hypothetical protein
MAKETNLPAQDVYVGDVLLANGSGELAGSGYYKTYYVDVNAGVDTNSGLSWTKALKHISPAIVLSNAAIAAGSKGWAARNRIFFKGDNNEAAKETLITLPNKCDVIGVGSYDYKTYPVMIGNHVIGSGTYMGTRFINMGFESLAAGGAIFTVPTTTSGLEFIGCYFDGSSTTKATYGISAVAVERLKIINCEFVGAISTAAIAIGAGESNGLVIKGNRILGAVNGITIASGMTTSIRGAVVADNYIDVTTLGINDEADKAMIVNNRILSAGGNGWAACAHFSIVRGSDNMITTANGVCYRVPLVAGAGALA